MNDWRPNLRSDLVFVPKDERGREGIQDPLLNRTVTFDDLAIGVARGLDGSRTLDELRALVPGEDVDDHVRNLVLLLMVEGSGDTVLERARSLDVYSAQENPVFLPEARFGCQSSGQCCQVYEFGPLREDDVARLDSMERQIRNAFPEHGGAPLYEKQETGLFLRKEGTRCAFLLNDGRCGIHAKFGPEAKPSFCRMFPWRAKLTLEGLKIFDQLECASFATSVRAGQTLEEQLPFVRSLLPPELWLEHPFVHVNDRVLADFSWVARLQDRSVALVGERRTRVGQTLQALGRLVRAYVHALETFPLEPGEPQTVLMPVIERPTEAWLGAPGEIERLEALRALAGVVQRLLAGLRDTPASPRLRPLLEGLLALTLHELDPASVALDPAWADSRSLPLTDDAEEVLRISMRNALFGDGALVDERMRPAVLRLALVETLAVVGGRLRAHAAGRSSVAPEDLSMAHATAGIVFREEAIRKLFVEDEALAFSATEAAALICG